MSTPTQYPKFRIYQGVLCLETDMVGGYQGGRKWWDWGHDLAYTPFKIANMSKVKVGKLMGSPRTVMAVETPDGWVAVNLPRTDILTLINLNAYPQELLKPYTTLKTYTPWPDKI